MDPKNQNFKKLQKEWYTKLRRSGFDDIENEYGDLRQINRRTRHYQDQNNIRDFFMILDGYLANTRIPKRDRRVLELYVSGKYDISGSAGIAAKTGLSPSTIHNILNKYTKIILDLTRS